jgi:hypothetical protein
MRLCGALFDRRLGLGERLSGPRHPMEWDHGSGELGCGAGRGSLRLPYDPDPGDDAHSAERPGSAASTARRADARSCPVVCPGARPITAASTAVACA